ncbi:hypothetical protein [uncultured Paludibaculum sp.]|uniref:hypothetical protein n=1 Tax=uncultured Paludibaculum sp. TaxID=1765020 RepID=UPI002AAAFF5F|nr:hypothetical protein [uncultured Paludibaculum sp.]
MRQFIAVLCVVSASSVFGQTAAPQIYEGTRAKQPSEPHRKRSADEFRLVTIAHLMQQPSPLEVGNTQLHRLGDQAAADIVKILGDGTLREAQVPIILDMLHKAFERPAAILRPNDRTPGATLFLLRTIAVSSHDPAITQRIEELRQLLAPLSASK